MRLSCFLRGMVWMHPSMKKALLNEAPAFFYCFGTITPPVLKMQFSGTVPLTELVG